MSNLALTLRAEGKLDEAERRLREALEIRRATLGPDHPMVAANLNDLGRVRQDAGDLAGAEDLYRRALAIYAPDHPWRPITEYNLATVLSARGEHTEALALFRKTLDRDRQLLGDEHPSVAGGPGSAGRHRGLLERSGQGGDEGADLVAHPPVEGQGLLFAGGAGGEAGRVLEAAVDDPGPAGEERAALAGRVADRHHPVEGGARELVDVT